jgi:hypothetical protein
VYREFAELEFLDVLKLEFLLIIKEQDVQVFSYQINVLAPLLEKYWDFARVCRIFVLPVVKVEL